LSFLHCCSREQEKDESDKEDDEKGEGDEEGETETETETPTKKAKLDVQALLKASNELVQSLGKGAADPEIAALHKEILKAGVKRGLEDIKSALESA
jgi:hypothetical protein